MVALYTKYRPKKFADVVGQTAITTTLKNALIGEHVSHAYLFCGSRGVGKTTLARLLAKAVNCTNLSDGEPCLNCEVCRGMEQGNFLDCIEIDAASNTGVDNIRNLIEGVSLRPSFGKYKIYIIDEVHMLSKGAFNALLKTLEEPPAYVIFILATTEIQKVPETILSRVQRFDFPGLSEALIRDTLAKIATLEGSELPNELSLAIAATAGGSLRDSLSKLDKVLSMGSTIDIDSARVALGVVDVSLVEDLFNHILYNSVGLPGFFDKMRSSGMDLALFNREVLEYIRKQIDNKVLNNIKNEGKLLERLTLADLIYLSRLFLKSYKEIPYSPSADIPIYLAACEVVHKFTTPKSTTVNLPPKVEVKDTEAKVDIEVSPIVKKRTPFKREGGDTIIENFDSNAQIDEQKLHMVWSQILDHIKVQNSPLGTLIKNSPIIKVEGATIWVAVKYLFHKEQIESSRNSQLLADSILKFMDCRARVLPKIVKTKEEVLNPVQVIEEALQVFGGELVE